MSELQKSTNFRRHVIVTGSILVFSAILVLILYKGLKFDQSKIPPTIVGKEAYAFRAEWVQGMDNLPSAADPFFSLEQLRGRLVVLNFWASWCVSCREEALELEAFWKEYKDKGVLVVGIAIQDTKEAAQKFAAHFGKTYILGLDHDGRISIDYGVTGVPETFIVNKDGIVVFKETGPVSKKDLEVQINKLL